MKKKIIFISALMLAICAGCSKEEEGGGQQRPDGSHDVAYVSLRINTPSGTPTKSSEEGASPAENAIKSLYAITFDKDNKIICYETDPAAQVLTGFDDDGESTTQKPDAFRVSSEAHKLLLIANPGTELEAVLNDADEGDTFAALNEALSGVTVSEINDAVKGFTMINSGAMVNSDTDATDPASLCMTDIFNKMFIVGDGPGQYPTPADAKKKAEEDGNRIAINMERLTVKVSLTSTITDGQPHPTAVLPADLAIFTFDGWFLDALNTTFYPWAKKVKLISSPGGGFYTNNFYTLDPNYDGNTGIAYTPLVDYAPDAVLLDKTATVYCIENTMRAGSQLYQNASRVIIKGKYYPDKDWEGEDWFSFSGSQYANLQKLRDAYDILTNENLREACVKFWTKIDLYARANGLSLTGTNFETLTTDDLDLIPNGGEVVKEEDCIRWYQRGSCYYYYEIQHDNSITGNQAFAKYGVVRNNFYNLTLTKVSKAGSPWFPSVDPGEGGTDPYPPGPIDETEGYIGVTVEIAPWVKWEHPIEV